jgi:hypothetical protein
LATLGYFAAAAYLIIGIVGGLWPSHWEGSNTTDQVLWFVFLCGGAVLLFAGLRLLPRSPWGGAVLVSLGAVLGALSIFWTIVVLIVAVALIVLSVRYARGASRVEQTTH